MRPFLSKTGTALEPWNPAVGLQSREISSLLIQVPQFVVAGHKTSFCTCKATLGRGLSWCFQNRFRRSRRSQHSKALREIEGPWRESVHFSGHLVAQYDKVLAHARKVLKDANARLAAGEDCLICCLVQCQHIIS